MTDVVAMTVEQYAETRAVAVLAVLLAAAACGGLVLLHFWWCMRFGRAKAEFAEALRRALTGGKDDDDEE